MPRKPREPRKPPSEATIRRLIVEAITNDPVGPERARIARAYDAGLLRAGVRFGIMLRDIADVVGCHPGASGMIADAIAEADRLAGEA